jgi:hypothetical protein
MIVTTTLIVLYEIFAPASLGSGAGVSIPTFVLAGREDEEPHPYASGVSNRQLEGLAVESSVSLTVTLQAEHADLGSLERAVAAALTQVGQVLPHHLLDRLEAAVPIPERCGCGACVKANGRAPRRLVTLAGEVELRHVHSPGVRKRALWLVTELSHARSAQTLDELRGIAVSRGEVHRSGGRGWGPPRGRPGCRDRGAPLAPNPRVPCQGLDHQRAEVPPGNCQEAP